MTITLSPLGVLLSLNEGMLQNATAEQRRWRLRREEAELMERNAQEQVQYLDKTVRYLQLEVKKEKVN